MAGEIVCSEQREFNAGCIEPVFSFLEMDALKVRRIKVQKNLFLQEEKELTVREYKRLFSTALREGKEQLAICMETIDFHWNPNQ